MEEQMRQSHFNAQELLRRFGASLDIVAEKVLYVLDGREDPHDLDADIGMPTRRPTT
jgi:hypothetical protein